MKKIIKIETSNKNYNIVIQKNSILSAISAEEKFNKKIFIIIDTKVSYKIKSLEKNKNFHFIKIKASEKIKSFEMYEKIILMLLKLKIDRDSTLIAIGGGTIGDLSGFIANTIMRGVRYVLMPTTLLSQVDSSIGGKNGINSRYGKNLIGTFFQPNKVIIDTSILSTLPKKEIVSGYAEILKHALIKDNNFYAWLKKNYSDIFKLKEPFITKAIISSIKIKAYFVQMDEKEKLINSSSRAMLNFGHTFGHALEALNSYSSKLSHGEAVAIGMALACKISFKKNLITKKDYYDLINHLKNVNLPFEDKRIKSPKLYNLMLMDKKNTNCKINLILLQKIGVAYYERGLSKKEIKNYLI